MPRQTRTPRVTTFTPPAIMIGRLALVSPRMRCTVVSPGVETVERVARQRIAIGNVVSVSVPQSTRYVDWPTIGRRWLQRRPMMIGAVTAVSPDGSLIEVQPLISATNFISRETGEIQCRGRYRVPTGEWLETGTPIDMDEALSGAYAPGVEPFVARRSHVAKVWTVGLIPSALIAALRQKARGVASARMYERLAAAGASPFTDRMLSMTAASRVMQRRDRDDVAHVYSVTKFLRKAVGYVVAGAHYAGSAATAVQSAANSVLQQHSHMRRGRSMLESDITAKLLAWVNRKAVARGCKAPLRIAGCGHSYIGAEHPGLYVLNRHSQEVGTHCPACALNAVGVMLEDGRVALCAPRMGRTYLWSDGSRRFLAEPSIIGVYHSSKQVVGLVAPLVRHNGDWPTIGFELEVQDMTGNRGPHAAAIRALVADHIPTAQVRRYMSFENDGSIGDEGFECVSGWTDLATHRTVMRHVLQTPDGKNRWPGKLRSHNAEPGCGLHVHIQKPKSLVHGAKLRYFMSAEVFKPIITATARRWNVEYARAAGGEGYCLSGDTPEIAAAKYAKQLTRGTYGEVLRPSKERMQSGIRRAASTMRLNADRYEHVNFHNQHTVEYRVFRGTTVFNTFMACLEMTQASWFYCRETPASAMSESSFLRFIERPEHRGDTACLRKLLKTKGFAVQVPNPVKGTAAAITSDETSELAVA